MQLDSSPFLDDGGYLLVRYEDFAVLPQVVAELVYSWSGLGKVPPSLVTWIDDNTKMVNCDDGADPGLHRDRRRSQNRQLSGGGGGGGDPAGAVFVADDGGAKEGGARTWVAAAASASPPPRKNLRPTEGFPPLMVKDLETSLSPQPPRVGHAHEPNVTNMPVQGGFKPSYGLPRPDDNTSATTTGATALEEEGEGLYLRRDGRRALEGSGGGGRGGRCDNKRHATEHPYSTKRHSQEMVDLWRQQMPTDDIKAVWEACQDSGVMDELRYSP